MAGAHLEEVAFWSSKLLEADLAKVLLENPAWKPDPVAMAADVVFSLD